MVIIYDGLCLSNSPILSEAAASSGSLVMLLFRFILPDLDLGRGDRVLPGSRFGRQVMEG